MLLLCDASFLQPRQPRFCAQDTDFFMEALFKYSTTQYLV